VAVVAAVIASTHHPFYYRASTSTGADRPPFADEWVAKIERFRDTLTRAAPDVLVMVGSDHFHQLWLDNMPQFLVGKAPYFDANFYNEEREFGLPRMTLRGEEDLAAHILRQGLDRGFDLAFSNELRIDHSITCPIITLRPQADLPIVPVYTNIFAPPMPQPGRFVELGRTLRALVESWPDERRVAIIGTGHLSLELGGPRQFGEHGPDPEFDRRAVEWIASGDIDGCLAEVTLDSLHQPGNATHGFMDFMLMMGDAGPVPHDGGLLHLVSERSAGMSKYLLDKFLFTVDRDPELVERYRTDPVGTVAWWEQNVAGQLLNCTTAERTTWLSFTDEERRVLQEQDHVALFAMGAHPFLTLTLFIAMFERDHGPLEYQRAYGAAMKHIALPYPDIAT
jgi:protocatechuate 4,5-dioxygenase, beta chain